jgi:hypothetical protein
MGRLLHAWRHMRANEQTGYAGTPLYVPQAGTNVVPYFSQSRDSALAADALSWLRKYLRPGRRRSKLEDEEAARLGEYLGVKTGMIQGYNGSISDYLHKKAARSRVSFSTYEREFFRSVARARRTIKRGLALDGVHVCPAPGTEIVSSTDREQNAGCA